MPDSEDTRLVVGLGRQGHRPLGRVRIGKIQFVFISGVSCSWSRSGAGSFSTVLYMFREIIWHVGRLMVVIFDVVHEHERSMLLAGVMLVWSAHFFSICKQSCANTAPNGHLSDKYEISVYLIESTFNHLQKLYNVR